MTYILEQHRDRSTNIVLYERVYEGNPRSLAKWTAETEKANIQAHDNKLRFIVEISKNMAKAFLKERGQTLL